MSVRSRIRLIGILLQLTVILVGVTQTQTSPTNIGKTQDDPSIIKTENPNPSVEAEPKDSDSNPIEKNPSDKNPQSANTAYSTDSANQLNPDAFKGHIVFSKNNTGMQTKLDTYQHVTPHFY